MNASIDFSGVLSGSIADGGGGGGGDTVIITPVVTSGTKIADVSVNGVEKDLYAPNPTQVIVTPDQQSGTKIGSIEVNGTEVDLYAPIPTQVSVTQVQQSGTKIATIGVNGVNTDLYAPEGGSGIIYSLEERIIGKWIDNRNIYEKTYNLGSVGIGSYGTFLTSYIDNINEIDKVLNAHAISLSVNESMNIMSYFDGRLLVYFYRNEDIEYITLQYIKHS